MKLLLGTAQFDGLYGRFRARIAQGSDELIAVAEGAGFCSVDTAAVYQGVEELIGRSRWSGPVHTKIDPALPPVISAERSLKRLGRSSLEVLYFHEPEIVYGHPSEIQNVRDLIPRKLVRHLGVSVYTPEEALQATRHSSLGVIQIPFNFVDGRWDSDLLQELKRAELKIVARSVLLQGALLSAPESLPGFLHPLKSVVSVLRSVALQGGRTPLETAIGWVRSFRELDGMVMGAETVSQIREIGQAWASRPMSADELEKLRPLRLAEPRVLDPREWPRV